MSDDQGSKSSGYAVTRFNAVRHGVLSKHTVLPWEDEVEYENLLRALVDEHKPTGPTEEHLVEELAGAMWRKRRLRFGEKAAHARALKHTTEQGAFSGTSRAALVLVTNDYGGRATGEAVSATEEQRLAALNALDGDEAGLKRALQILEDHRNKKRGLALVYQDAVAALTAAEQKTWTDLVISSIILAHPGQTQYHPNVDSLREYIPTLAFQRCRDRRFELENRDLIRQQSFGEAVNAPELEGLARYEVHLDRKFERTLAMLVKLQNLRRPPPIDAE